MSTDKKIRVVRFCGPDWQNVRDRGKWWWSIGDDDDGYEDNEPSAYEAMGRALRARDLPEAERCIEVSHRDGSRCPMRAALEGRCLSHAGIHMYSHRSEEEATGASERTAGRRLACFCGSDATYVVGSISEPAQALCCDEHAKAWVSAVPLPRMPTDVYIVVGYDDIEECEWFIAGEFNTDAPGWVKDVTQALGMLKDDALDWVRRVPGVTIRKRSEER